VTAGRIHLGLLLPTREAVMSGRPEAGPLLALAERAEGDGYDMEDYCGVPYEVMAARQGCYAGSAEGAAEWLHGFVEAGARHLVLRLAGPDQADQLRQATRGILPRLGS
jgi:hypothetical protein